MSADGQPVSAPPPGRSSTGKGAKEFKDWLGGYFEQHWSVNPHWLADFKSLPDHPASRGVKPFATTDEWYFNMRFRDGMEGVTPILAALAPEATMNRGMGPHNGNPDVRKLVLARPVAGAAGDHEHVLLFFGVEPGEAAAEDESAEEEGLLHGMLG